MFPLQVSRILGIAVLLTAPACSAVRGLQAAQSKPGQPADLFELYAALNRHVSGGSAESHWLDDGSLWYRRWQGGDDEYRIVDPNAGTTEELLDPTRAIAAITQLTAPETSPSESPGGLGVLGVSSPDKTNVRVTIGGAEYLVERKTYAVKRAGQSPSAPQQLPPPTVGSWIRAKEEPSPDGRWLAGVTGSSLYLRNGRGERHVIATTKPEEPPWSTAAAQWDSRGWQWRWSWWAPSGRHLAIKRLDPAGAPRFPVIDYLQPSLPIRWVKDKTVSAPELFIVDAESRNLSHVKTPPASALHVLGWTPDGSEIFFFTLDRGFKTRRVHAFRPEDGRNRIVMEESRETSFKVPTWWGPASGFSFVSASGDFLWMTDTDGWLHLHHYSNKGEHLGALTSGAFPVVQLLGIDASSRWAYFTAHSDAARPYDLHLCRSRLINPEVEQLTRATGIHDVQASPALDYFVDTHSSFDRPPSVELLGADGTVIRLISKGELREPFASNWAPPEEFVAVAADKKTRLFGLIYKPHDFDSNKKYPVIDHIYGGPHIAYVNRRFTSHRSGALPPHALAQLGYIVVTIDARGTPERGSAFQDVGYGRVGQFEIADHVAALKQAAASRPHMDLSRAGIVGASFGGYFAVRGLLQAPDFFRAGVAISPLSHLISSPGHGHFEEYMDLPDANPEGYLAASNVQLAGRLQSPLLIAHGTQDDDVPLSHTVELVDALINSNKDHELVLLPGQGHFSENEAARAYVRQKAIAFLRRHLNPDP